jgi:hypothetical protein
MFLIVARNLEFGFISGIGKHKYWNVRKEHERVGKVCNLCWLMLERMYLRRKMRFRRSRMSG